MTEPVANLETSTNPRSQSNPSIVGSWFFLIWLSIQRQMRAHLMAWISLGLLCFSVFIVALISDAGRWSMEHWRYPRRDGMEFGEFVLRLEQVRTSVPFGPSANSVYFAATGSVSAFIKYGSGFVVFSTWVVFGILSSFLLPIWTLSFATEGLGREREDGNLIWLLTRPLSRPAIYLAKYVRFCRGALVSIWAAFGSSVGRAAKPQARLLRCTGRHCSSPLWRFVLSFI